MTAVLDDRSLDGPARPWVQQLQGTPLLPSVVRVLLARLVGLLVHGMILRWTGGSPVARTWDHF